MKQCPICGGCYKNHPAISRRDNYTEICPRCGVLEALEDFGMSDEKADLLLQQIMKVYSEEDRYIK